MSDNGAGSKSRIKQLALETGFDLAGVAPAEPLPDDIARLEQWLAGGMQAGMGYMKRNLSLRREAVSLTQVILLYPSLFLF